jgi:hypothetical protein
VIRCIECLRTGKWPERLHDVEELETMLLHEKQDVSELMGELKDVEDWEERQGWDDASDDPDKKSGGDEGGQRR